jgi:O-acetyl-ADP-ribose deacetylase (regulator of RNase III)
MLSYNEVNGDLIELAKKGNFDVIAHGCNCRSVMKSGIAVQMAKTFGCNKFPMECTGPSIQKLANIDFKTFVLGSNGAMWDIDNANNRDNDPELCVVNAYTQNMYGKNHLDGITAPVDYEAITLCMRKMNVAFKGKHIGLPLIGAGLAGGDWEKIKNIIKTELSNCHITIVIYDKRQNGNIKPEVRQAKPLVDKFRHLECRATNKEAECWKVLGRCVICEHYV